MMLDLGLAHLSLFERLAVMLLAINEWTFVLLYVYCLKRFRGRFAVKLIAAVLAILSSVGAVVAQRRLYHPVPSGRFSVNEFDAVVITEKIVSLFLLFYGMSKFWQNWTVAADNQGSSSSRRLSVPHSGKQ